MADQDEEPEEADEAEEPRSKGGPLKLLVAMALLIATGGVLAMMAIPGKEKEYKLQGPYFAKLFEEPITVTVQDNDQTRYIKFTVDAEYVAYDEAYFGARGDDPFFQAYLRSRAEMVASSRTVSETAAGPQRERFAAALRTALNPIVFPIHIGKTKNPLDKDNETGLRPGVSHNEATFRGRFHDHILRVDGPAHILQLDHGPEITFNGDEDDLEVRDALGNLMFVDLTHFKADFVGQVKVGVHGKLRHVVLSAIAQ